jgi:Recombination endonuclease VII
MLHDSHVRHWKRVQYYRAWRVANIEYVRDFDRKRGRRPSDPAKRRVTERAWVKRRRAKDPEWYQARREVIRKWQADNRPRINVLRRKYREADPSKELAAGLRWRQKNREHMRSRYLKAAIGITMDDKRQMLAAQNGLCKICGIQLETMRKANVDHCHKSGRVRGVLCYHCNVGIGFLRDNPETCEKAAAYLRESAGICAEVA